MEDALQTDKLGTENVEGENKAPEIDYNSLDPGKLAHGTISQTEAFKGLMREVQMLRGEKEDLKEAHALLLKEYEDKPQSGSTEEDDDYPTLTKVKEVVAELVGKEKLAINAEREKERAQALIAIQNESLRKLVADKAQDKTPGMPDAETVVMKGGAYLQRNNRELFEAAMRSNDPAGNIYKLALTFVPELVQAQESARNARLLEQVKSSSIPGQGTTGGESESDLRSLFDIASQGEAGFAKVEAELLSGEDVEDLETPGKFRPRTE